jgi:fibronectin-binding autotransporter adhesin
MTAAVAAASAALLPSYAASAANPPIVISGGVTTVNGGNTSINGTSINNYAGGIFLYGSGNVVNDSDGQGPNSIETGVLFVDDGNGFSSNYFGSTQITLNGGTFEYHGGPTATNPQTTPSTTVTNLSVATGGIISARPQGGGGTLAITNFTVNPTSTVTFESEWAPIGSNGAGVSDYSTDIGKVVITNLNGKAITNQDGNTDGTSIIGGWATVASFGGDPNSLVGVGSGLPGFASVGLNGIQEVVYQGTTISGSTAVTDNIRTTGEVIDGTAGTPFHINSLVSVGAGGGATDVQFTNNAQLILESGGLVMGQGGHWLKSDSGTGSITAGALGGYNLYATTTQDGDYRIWNLQITDNGTNPVQLIKGGPGRFTLDPHNDGHELYTGGTIVNQGILEIANGGNTGTFAPNTNVTVNGGGTLQVDATDGLGWGTGSINSLTVNANGRVFANGGTRVTLTNTTNLNGGVLDSSPTNGDGNGSYSFSGQTNATSAVTGPAKIVAANITLQSTNTVFNVTAGGNGPVDLLVTSNIGEFQGSHALVKNGNGVMVLSSAGTYSNGTTINAGTLRVGNTAALGTGTVTLNGGTLQTASNTLGSAGGSVSGFTNFQLNTNNVPAGTGASISPDNATLTLTDANNSEARSAFFKTAVGVSNTNGFTASFVYTNLSGNAANPADGVAFVLQNDPRGSTALGDPGGAFGYGGNASIVNSGAAELNIFGGAGGGRGVAFGLNGSIPGNNGTGPVDLSNGDPIQVGLVYNGTNRTVVETLTDTITPTNTFTFTYFGVDFQSLLGGSSGFVGFTGATGGATANQTVSNFTFTSNPSSAPASETYNNAVSVLGNATIDVTGGRSVTFGTLAIGTNTLSVTSSDNATTPFSLTTGAVTLGGNATFNVLNSAGGGPGKFAPGAIGGAFGINKAGPGTMLLAANSNYTGPTVIQGGIVLANNATSSTGTGSVTVQTGAKLGGTGTIAGLTTVNAGGIISAGDAAVTPGKLTIGGATTFAQGSGTVGDVNNGATYLWKINSATGGAGNATGWDELVVQTLALGPGIGGTAVTIQPVSFSGTAPGPMAGFNPNQSFRWALINVATGGALPPASNFVLDSNALSSFATANGTSGGLFSVTEGADPTSGTDVFIQFSPAPEPTSLSLLGLGAAGLLLRRRRLPMPGREVGDEA